jgi:sigma-E factor negative regulatory protein RseB
MQVVAKRAVLIVVLAAGLIASTQAAEESANEARGWLARMSEALATRNYDARFLHLVGSHAENMRIIHRVADGAVTERLVSLDGSGREVVRTQSELVCYLPDRRTVLVEKRTDNNSLLGTVPVYSEGLQTYYALATPGTTRILGRAAQYVTVQPRDNFRYGYRLWLDQETALPLKSQLCDRAGRVIEQIVFSDLDVPASIDAALLKSSISTVGFQWIRQELRAQRVPNQGNAPASGWVVVNPPQGFRLTVTRVRNFGSAAPVQHLVLSDGLASVSVFIESSSDARSPANGSVSATAQGAAAELSRVGSALAYSTETQEHRITAVGEVPANTLRAIVTSVQRESVNVNAQPSAPNNNTAPEDHTR